MIRVSLSKENRVGISFSGDNFYQILQLVRGISSASYDKDIMIWNIPIDEFDNFVSNDIIKSEIILSDENLEKCYANFIDKKEIVNDIKSAKLPSIKFDGFDRTMMPFQTVGTVFLYNIEKCILADSVGLGKQNINGTPVLSKDGFVPIETLKVGDKIYGRDGQLHNVTGVFPQGKKPIYRVTFIDNSIADVGLEHLWSVKSNNDRARKKPWRTVDTKFLIDNGLRWSPDKYDKCGSPIWNIPLVEPINLPEKYQLIPPYIMGTLIADGSLLKSIRFVPGDKAIPKIVEHFIEDKNYKLHEGADYGTSTAYSIIYKKANKGSKHPNPWIQYIKKIGLNIHGDYKFIPKRYLYGSIRQRKLLLAGLLDGDRTVKGARTRYATTSLRLATNMVELVQSLGGMAVISTFKGRKRIRNGKKCLEKDLHNISIRLNYNPFIKKSNKIKWKRSAHTLRKIDKIEYLKDDYATCIAVDAPDKLYVINDYIVTHNSCQALLAAYLHNVDHVLIVCPAALIENWEIELACISKDCYTDVREYTKAGRKTFYLNPQKKYILFSYNMFTNDINDIYDTFKHKRCLVIADEIQYIKNYSAMRTKALIKFSKTAKYFYGLSATYLETGLENLQSIFQVINEDIFGRNIYKFYNEYVNMDYMGKVNGYKNIDKIKKKIYPYVLRRNKEEVLDQLPKRIELTYWVELTAVEQKRYEEIRCGLIKEIKDQERANKIMGAPNLLAMIQYLQQACLHPQLVGSEGESSKLKELINIIGSLDDKKILIFCTYTKMVELISEKLNKAGHKSIYIHGQTKFDKYDVLKQFQTDNSIRVLVCSEVFREGVNGLTVASTIIHFNLLWNPAKIEQRTGRIDRIGQLSEHINVIYVVAKKTVEMDIYERVQSRQKLYDDVVNDNFQSDRTIIIEQKSKSQMLNALMHKY